MIPKYQRIRNNKTRNVHLRRKHYVKTLCELDLENIDFQIVDHRVPTCDICIAAYWLRDVA